MHPKLSSQAERGLYSAIGKAKSNGLDAVSQLAKKHSIAGVYGPLIELINCPGEYKTAVEVTAGDQLFNIVVDNDETAGGRFQSNLDRIQNTELAHDGSSPAPPRTPPGDCCGSAVAHSVAAGRIQTAGG